MDFLMTCGIVAVLLAAALGAGSWLERGGKSDDDDYYDD